MTDEGRRGDPIETAEAIAGIRSAATLAWNLFQGCLEEGFEVAQALKLTGAFIHGAGGGKLEQ
jgi:hypothetical protein